MTTETVRLLAVEDDPAVAAMLTRGLRRAGYEYVVTGAVLLLAAGFDAVVRRRGQVS